MPGRYATALFELALEEGKLDNVVDDVDQFKSMLDASEDLRRLIANPIFTAEDQRRAVTAILKKAEISTLTSNFFALVAANRRIFAVADMIKAFRALLARHRG